MSDKQPTLTLISNGCIWEIKIDVLGPERKGKTRGIRFDLNEPFTIPAGPCYIGVPPGEWNYEHDLSKAIQAMDKV